MTREKAIEILTLARKDQDIIPWVDLDEALEIAIDDIQAVDELSKIS